MTSVGPQVVLDVGGTTIKGAIDLGDGLRDHRRWPTPRGTGPDAVVAAVVDAAAELTAAATRTAGTPPVAIGAACMGLVDPVGGIAVRSAAAGWSRVPLAALIAERTGVRTALVHDIAAAATAEAAVRTDAGPAPLFFVAVGTGVGGATVVGGRPVIGAHHRAGEIGHIPVPGHDEPCGCGRRGCLERVVSAAGMVRAYTARTGTDPGGALGVAERASAGEPDAVAVWRGACDALADALTVYSVLVDPAVIVLGGGVALAGDQLVGPVRERLRARLGLPGVPVVEAARLGDGAALLGARTAAADLVAGR